ncbi:TetR family transcriptional regulator [Thalassospira sp. HJ]|uniref:TetR/AcrR family transcriptional regulator n=1 Tax=Thalassospira sp. HJ TaxID=1616823 RepID=UPI0005CF569D|nr:TetR/AcrR family transcriptional regulator [Thalassospira sp. HJ]KJE34920.1 TetR family transcriptional regulator [Thalassospira sp. HJ]
MGRHREFDAEQVLDAALNVFWKKGYEGTSLDDLTRETGVARPGLYSVFGNKEALFLKALDSYEAKYMTFMQAALNEPTSYAVVAAILKGSFDLQTRNDVARGCLGVNGALACSDSAEPIRLELVRRRNASEQALCDRLERARQEGDLSEAADPAVLAKYVMTVSQGMAVQAKAGATKEHLEAVIKHVLATWPAARNK